MNESTAIARAPTPLGPFVNVKPITMQGGAIISDTVALFVDDDNKAYVRYNTRDGNRRWHVDTFLIQEKID